MSDPSVEALREYLRTGTSKGIEMVELTDEKLNLMLSDAREQGFRQGKESGVKSYKEELAPVILDYARRYGLCTDGVREFCEEMGIPLETEYNVTVTISMIVTSTDEDKAEMELQDIKEALMNKARELDGVKLDRDNCEHEVTGEV